MTEARSEEPQWLDVWACDHLWALADVGDVQAQNAIGEAGINFLCDLGENVALCPDCTGALSSISMTLRHVALEEDDFQRFRESRSGRSEWDYSVRPSRFIR